MNDQEKVLAIMERIFNYDNDKKKVAILNPKINKKFECTGDSDCKRCPEWWKARPQHAWN
jgi:acyl-ACP thioesterase